MCSVARFNRHANNVLCSTDFMWPADEVATPDDRSASAKLTTGLQALHELLNVESAQQQNLTGRTALSAPLAKKRYGGYTFARYQEALKDNDACE